MSVAPDELNGTEQAVLLVLMAECRPVPNPELKKLGPELKKPDRDRLRGKKLIEVKPGRPMVITLSEDGWAFCKQLIGADVPDRPSGQGKALYTVLKSLRRYLDLADLAPADVFSAAVAVGDARARAEPRLSQTADGEKPDVETCIRTAYDRLARRPGGWVDLVSLRSSLGEISRRDVDAALVRLYQSPGVNLIPEENQKVLTDEDRAASVVIGNQHKHLIAIES